MAVNNSGAYDFGRFETNTAAPQQTSGADSGTLKKLSPSADGDIKFRQRTAFYRAVRMFVFVAVMCAAVVMQISAAAQNFAVERDIHKLEYDISVAQSENVRLRAELNGITGIAFIDNYATEVLGMTKVESYQVECVDLSGEDTIIYSGNTFAK